MQAKPIVFSFLSRLEQICLFPTTHCAMRLRHDLPSPHPASQRLHPHFHPQTFSRPDMIPSPAVRKTRAPCYQQGARVLLFNSLSRGFIIFRIDFKANKISCTRDAGNSSGASPHKGIKHCVSFIAACKNQAHQRRLRLLRRMESFFRIKVDVIPHISQTWLGVINLADSGIGKVKLQNFLQFVPNSLSGKLLADIVSRINASHTATV